jgi:hypothetical protein
VEQLQIFRTNLRHLRNLENREDLKFKFTLQKGAKVYI